MSEERESRVIDVREVTNYFFSAKMKSDYFPCNEKLLNDCSSVPLNKTHVNTERHDKATVAYTLDSCRKCEDTTKQRLMYSLPHLEITVDFSSLRNVHHRYVVIDRQRR